MLSGNGKMLLMLRAERAECKGSGWARICYEDYSGKVQLSVQDLSRGQYDVYVSAGGCKPVHAGSLRVCNGRGNTECCFAFKGIKECSTVAIAVVCDGEIVLCGYKGGGVKWRNDISAAARQKRRCAEKSEAPHCCTQQRQRRYFETVRSYFDEIFSQYNAENDPLRHIIPDSKWKQVEYNDCGGKCLVGLVYEDDGYNVRFICYGVPGPCADDGLGPTLSSYCQFIPDETGENGWWMMYQDAITGDTIVL